MSSSGNSTTIPPDQYGALLKTGYVMILQSGHLYPDLSMQPLVEALLRNATTEKIGTIPTRSLVELADILPGLSRSTPDIAKGIIIIVVLVTLSILTTALRFYSRRMKTRELRSDDWLSLVALIFVIMDGACTIVMQLASVHIWQFSLNRFIMWNKALYATEIVFVFTHFFVKLTYLMFYHSLSPKRSYRITLLAIGIFIFGFSLAGLFAFIFQCRPIDFWNHLSDRKCIDAFSSLLAFGVMYIIADILILLLPVTTVVGLQLRRKEKMVVVGIFSAMAFVCIASIERLLSLRSWFGNPDFTYKRIGHGIWANVELNLALMISCLPALKILLFPTARFKKTQITGGQTAASAVHHEHRDTLRITRRYEVSMESVAELNPATRDDSLNGTKTNIEVVIEKKI